MGEAACERSAMKRGEKQICVAKSHPSLNTTTTSITIQSPIIVAAAKPWSRLAQELHSSPFHVAQALLRRVFGPRLSGQRRLRAWGAVAAKCAGPSAASFGPLRLPVQLPCGLALLAAQPTGLRLRRAAELGPAAMAAASAAFPTLLRPALVGLPPLELAAAEERPRLFAAFLGIVRRPLRRQGPFPGRGAAAARARRPFRQPVNLRRAVNPIAE